tara:strand:- start:2027 stop:3040 length:1014 start_codon:yes stop_codon:yes gene_type:complete
MVFMIGVGLNPRIKLSYARKINLMACHVSVELASPASEAIADRQFPKGRDLGIAVPGISGDNDFVVIEIRQLQRPLYALAAGFLLIPPGNSAESPEAVGRDSSGLVMDRMPGDSGSRPRFLPAEITKGNFSALRERSPFLRTVNTAGSVILTGIARIEDKAVASLIDLETNTSYLVSEGERNSDGWQLIEVKGDPSDFETLTARVKVAGGEVVSIRYEKSPPGGRGSRKVIVSTRIGNGSAGGGTDPHGGPDPSVLTPDQLADARNGARNINGGFQADGYADKDTVPPQVVSKLSRLSVQQREGVNVKMFEYRNRGLGMKERQQIYNNLLDKELKSR